MRGGLQHQHLPNARPPSHFGTSARHDGFFLILPANLDMMFAIIMQKAAVATAALFVGTRASRSEASFVRLDCFLHDEVYHYLV